MKINFGKGLFRLYVIISVFWTIFGLLEYYKALAPHVGINYWTEESYVARTKKSCATEIPPSFECLPDGTVLVSVYGYPTNKEIAEAPKEFFYLFIGLPIILLLIFSAVYKGVKWVIKGFNQNVND